MADRILILGASARAAAASARRAGLTPFAIDLFADRDTQILCEKVWRCPLDRYPEGLFELAKQAPPMPWMYTGGLENYPELVGALANERELWGNGPEVLRRVRDPQELFSCLASFKRDVPTFLPSHDPPEGNHRWLRKPLCGSGGIGVRFATTSELTSTEAQSDYVLQAYVPGRSMSAMFRLENGENQPQFIGLSDQLVGCDWLHAKPFAYCGSIVSHPYLGPDTRPVAYWLTHHFSVIDIWGFDFILPVEGRFLPVEVNPRYPASAEIYEYATGVPVLKANDMSYPTRPIGKAIYYAPHRITFPASGPWDTSLSHVLDVWNRPDFADIPHPGDIIEAEQPVITIFAEAATEAECLAQLQSQAAELDRLFGFSLALRMHDAHDE